uniref:Pentatricopeptide repeat-containing protein n=1 Tax=Ananas comosus var. bracteatus TaxID=296719 RepID=A0A6V7QS44_ANACO
MDSISGGFPLHLLQNHPRTPFHPLFRCKKPTAAPPHPPEPLSLPEHSHAERLRSSVKSKSVEEAMELLTEMKRKGVRPGVALESMLVDLLMKSDRVGDAFDVFGEMPERNVVAWTSMISGCVRNGRCGVGFSLFVEMMESGLLPNDFSLNAALAACAHMAALRLGEQVHSLIVRLGLESDCRNGNSLIDFYSRCGLISNAKAVFDRMPELDLVSYTSLISGLCTNESFESAVWVFDRMVRHGLEPNEHTIASILTACGLPLGEQIHGYMIKTMIAQSVYSASALIDLYSRNNEFESASTVFQHLEPKNVVSWNSMIASCVRNEQVEDALQLFVEMVIDGLNANEFAFATAIGACGLSSESGEFGRQLHGSAIKHNMMSDIRVYNALLSMYGRGGRIKEMESVIAEIEYPDVVSWSAAISGYFQNSFDERSTSALCRMHSMNYRPNEYAFSSALSSCANLALLDQGRQFHCLALKLACDLDTSTGNALINMYSKCGCIGDAKFAFDAIPTHDVTSWNSLIHGYAHHGHAKEALKVFNKMEPNGVMPDQLTFVGILAGFSHAGLVDEAEKYFKLMTDRYGIEPSPSHYACMIGMMGRSGRIEEALCMINSMPCEADIVIWKALLGSCRLHRNLEAGKIALEKVMQLSRKDSAGYVLMSNLHAMHGEWSDADRVRRKMDDMGVKKDAGWSWIEVKNEVHTFVARDTSHPKSALLYQRLRELLVLMKDEGYSPDLGTLSDDLLVYMTHL